MRTDKIRFYVNGMFETLPKTKDVIDIKQNILESMEDKYSEYVGSGMDEDEAFSKVVKEFGNIEEIKTTLGLKDNSSQGGGEEFFSGSGNGYERVKKDEPRNFGSQDKSNGNCGNSCNSGYNENQFRKNVNETKLQGNLTGLVMLLFVIGFFIAGAFGYWHPAWVLIPIGGVFCGILGILFEIHNSKKRGLNNKKNISGSISGLIMLSAVIIYMLLGVFADKWHPAWVIFPLAAVLCGITGTIGDFKNSRGNYKKITGAVCGLLMLLITAAYFYTGFVYGWWHPGWIMFPIGGILCGIISIIGEMAEDHKNGK